MSDIPTAPPSPPGPGWWRASDGSWYPPPPGPGPPLTASKRPNNGYAVASLIVSIVVCFVGSFLAVIFGHIALHQIARTGQGGRGLAIAGLVLGYVGIVAMIVAVIVLFPLTDPDTDIDFVSIVRS